MGECEHLLKSIISTFEPPNLTPYGERLSIGRSIGALFKNRIALYKWHFQMIFSVKPYKAYLISNEICALTNIIVFHKCKRFLFEHIQYKRGDMISIARLHKLVTILKI